MKKKSDINIEFLWRELCGELHLPLSVVKPVVQRIFLKILKHLMMGRSIRIKGFGKFDLHLCKEKYLASPIAGEQKILPPKILPKFIFSKEAKNLVTNSHSVSEERSR